MSNYGMDYEQLKQLVSGTTLIDSQTAFQNAYNSALNSQAALQGMYTNQTNTATAAQVLGGQAGSSALGQMDKDMIEKLLRGVKHTEFVAPEPVDPVQAAIDKAVSRTMTGTETDNNWTVEYVNNSGFQGKPAPISSEDEVRMAIDRAVQKMKG